MSDVVFDATVVAFSNKGIASRKPGNSFDRRLRLLESTCAGRARVRYNMKLLGEYQRLVAQFRNDVIELFFTTLDSTSAIRVARNNLSRQYHQLAVGERWPTHDQHLLAAALGGDRPSLYVTERCHSNCSDGIYRLFRIRVELV